MLSSENSLIIFTRYPQLGKTKTRLIPAMGAENATNLQRLMTEKTISTVEQFSKLYPVDINIFFDGGTLDLMKSWLGNQYIYYSQKGEDLGLKMYSAFQDIFSKGSQKVVIIGIDCPDLTTDILTTAFNQLNYHDLVIGKAFDGGYYLLGLKQLEKEFFVNISWSTSQVFNQTVTIAHRLNYKIYTLPTLSDIDRPEDLKFWRG